jgi:hypothetical protein
MDISDHHLWWLGRNAGMEGLNMNIPAFPQADAIKNEFHEKFGTDRGMTLRDYFAAKAMQAIIARADNRFTTTVEFVGGKSYQYADAMLKARQA